EVGGGLIAAALAYRLFIWLLPLALVAVGGLGVAADAEERSPEGTAGAVGLAGLLSRSVANAADGPGHWYALIVGIPILVYESGVLLRSLLGAHRLVWGEERGARRVTMVGTLRLLALLLCFPLASALVGAFGIVAAILSIVAYVLL